MPLPDRVRLVVLFGGRSAEHDISRISASHVLRAVDPQRYDVVPVAISRDGRWHSAARTAELLASGRLDELPEKLETDGPEVSLSEVLLGPDGSDRSDAPTVVMPILHGPYGEDGSLQGLVEMLDVPFVGSGVLGSAVSMDKAMAKTVLDAHRIAQPRWRAVRPADLVDRPSVVQELIGVLGRDLFVKPANMGSSIGVSKVSGNAELVEGLRTAFLYDDVAVVEEQIAARELECGILGNERPRATVLGEIVPGADFYDYADKYDNGVAQIVIPAEVDEDLVEQGRQLALDAYAALRCEGMARVDLFYEATGADGEPGRGLLVNEVNTIPGFTPISMYPMLWQHAGLSYPELVDELVALALERHRRRSGFSTEHLET